MTLLMTVAVLVTVLYAVNTLKLRMVARGRPLRAAAFEAAQGFMYVYVIVRIVDSTNTMGGAIAYVAGAFTGTLAAMLLHRRHGAVPDHYHLCCPPSGPGVPVPSQAKLPQRHTDRRGHQQQAHTPP